MLAGAEELSIVLLVTLLVFHSLLAAMRKSLALMTHNWLKVVGDPLAATTHTDLLARCQEP
jgi:hypothetical protein